MRISPEWLVRRVEDAPTSYQTDDPDRNALRTRMAWQKLKRNAREGDEVWAYANPQSTWRKLGKLTGYAIVRDGDIIESVETD